MAITSDYIVVSDAAITLVPLGGDSDRKYTFTIPIGAKIAPSQNPILTFMAWANGGIVRQASKASFSENFCCKMQRPFDKLATEAISG